MKSTLPPTSLPHFDHIKKITDIITKVGGNKIVAVILFGSFARGDWVFDRYSEGNAIYSYASDYDFLIIKKSRYKDEKEEISDFDLEKKIIKELEIKSCVRNRHSPQFVIEPLDYVNSELTKGRYFFSDIKKEGIMLFASGELELSEPKILSEEEAKEMAREDWDHWFGRAEDFLLKFKTLFEIGRFESSAFDLHQATESLYNSTLLVLTGYKPKTHDLIKLGQLCSAQSNQFLPIFPNADKEQKPNRRNFSKDSIQQFYNSTQREDWFKLLQMAYIDARYNKHFKIRKEQLEYLLGRVQLLKGVVEMVCWKRI